LTPNLKKMRRISVIWGIFLFLLVIGLTIIGFVYKKETKEYKELEQNISKKAQEYVEENGLYEDNDFKIEITTLIEQEKIEPVVLESHGCTGYVSVKKMSGIHKFITYIDCGKYKTKGYKKD